MGKTVTQTRVSIHAPVKGAILGGGRKNLQSGVSIHAPVKGAIVIVICMVTSLEFQSTHP